MLFYGLLFTIIELHAVSCEKGPYVLFPASPEWEMIIKPQPKHIKGKNPLVVI